MRAWNLVAAGMLVVCAAGSTYPSSAATKRYRTCAELRTAYAAGVGRKGATDKVIGGLQPSIAWTVNGALYASLGKALDPDRDGIACETSLPTTLAESPTTSAQANQPTTTIPALTTETTDHNDEHRRARHSGCTSGVVTPASSAARSRSHVAPFRKLRRSERRVPTRGRSSRCRRFRVRENAAGNNIRR